MLCPVKPLFAFLRRKKCLQNFFSPSLSPLSLSVAAAAPCVIRNPNEMEIRAKLCSHWSAHLRKKKKGKKHVLLYQRFGGD